MSMLIFGGSRGIGKMLATYFAMQNKRITVAARKLDDLTYAKNKLREQGVAVTVVVADVTEENQVEAAFAAHESAYGEKPAVVINAAALQGPIGEFWTLPASEWQKTINVNITGSFIVAKVAVANFMESKRGTVILFSGGGAAYSRPNFTAYGASKTAVLRLVETAADEIYAAGYEDVTIHAIAPGAVKTDMTYEILQAKDYAGQKALREAEEVLRTGGTSCEEIATLIEFLSNPDNSRVLSGRLIHVREPFKQFVADKANNKIEEAGKLRRIPLLNT